MKTIITLVLLATSINTVNAYGMDLEENQKLEIARFEYCSELHTQVTYRRDYTFMEQLICWDVIDYLDNNEIARQIYLINDK